MKPSIPAVLTTFSLLCFALVQNTQAVSPPPDGGYSGGNTAEGHNALLSLTTGHYNTANGYRVLDSNTTGSGNTAIGATALSSNTTGDSNTANGYRALDRNTTGSLNTASGGQALFSNTTGGANTANGFEALFSNTHGPSNTANGYEALANNTTGGANTALGYLALFGNTTANANTAIGDGALVNNTTGNNNTALGASAGQNVTTANNVICIGADGNNMDNSCFIGNIFGVTSSGGAAVFINSDGNLGTMTSSRRFKEEIKPMEQASEAVFALKPVTFHYKKDIDPRGAPQLGLVAEDVEKVNPDLIVRDKEGKPYSVRYDQVNAMLLNEFLKEHRTVQEQGALIAKQQLQIEALTAGLQKVSVQVEMNKPTTQTVLNNQ